MSEKDFIKGLTDDLEPCKPLKHPAKRMLPWLLLALVYVFVVCVFFIGLRENWYHMLMHDPKFQLDMGLAFAVFITSGLVLGWVNLPDMYQQEWVLSIPLIAVAAFFINMFYTLFTADFSQPEYDMMCFPHSAALTIIPLGYLISIIRNGCPNCHRLSAFFATLTVSAIGWIGLRLTSSIDHAAQTFLIQFLPFILLGVVLGVLSSKLFRW